MIESARMATTDSRTTSASAGSDAMGESVPSKSAATRSTGERAISSICENKSGMMPTPFSQVFGRARFLFRGVFQMPLPAKFVGDLQHRDAFIQPHDVAFNIAGAETAINFVRFVLVTVALDGKIKLSRTGF